MNDISVIIPVYNAALYIEKAVKSVLQQESVGEIILIEDNSGDNSLEVCVKLASENKKVRLYTHSEGINKGAAASRNLGLEKSNCELIAFLDADDLYLQGRFDKTSELFKKYPDADGFYGKATYHFYSQRAKDKYQAIYGSRLIVGLSKPVVPELLFDLFMSQIGEWFILDSIILKKTCLKKVGLFDCSLRQTQDTDFLLRCCLYGRFYSTEELEPKVSIGIHDNNRVLNQVEADLYRFLLLKKWLRKAMDQHFSKPVNRYLIRSFLDIHPAIVKYRSFPINRVLAKIHLGLRFIISNPKDAFDLLRKAL